MGTPNKADFLKKCRTKKDVREYAKEHNMPIRNAGKKIVIGGWTCVFDGDKLLFVE